MAGKHVIHGSVNNVDLKLTLCASDVDKYMGLSHTKEFDDNQGMLFLFPEPRKNPVFSMRGMNYPIDILFFNDKMRCVFMANMQKLGEGNQVKCPSDDPILYVLEVRDRWALKHKIKTGDYLVLGGKITGERPL